MGQSRTENILENMLGASNPIPEPQSREETLLKQILESGGGGSKYTETTLYNPSTFDTFIMGSDIILSDNADNYDEIRIYFCYYEQADGGYYAHRRVDRIDKSTVLWSISERQQTGTDRGVIDLIGSYEQSGTYGTWRVYFSDKKTIHSHKKSYAGWNGDKLGIEKIIGVKY